jgi:predicted CXXCH cytochrome family protein
VRSVAVEVKTPVDLSLVSYTTSAPCVVCHPDRHETWRRTFHRTMTQRAGPEAVRGDFENATLTFQGVTSRFTHEGNRYFIETLSLGGAMERHEVAMTIGSRRIQQYVTRIGDRHVRLPLAWDIEERRWIHLNGGFLHPDGSDFNTHRAVWDANCIFCHNVKAQPGFEEASNTFNARVAELGIACEACHGPGELHVKRNADPLRRYLLYFGGHDPTIHSPKVLPRMRQIQICGHCHGQRLPNPPQRIAQFMIAGDPYTAGDDLSRVTTPISAHTELPGADFRLRFWNDGTPRLTAYEYQGLLMSDGHEDSKLTCISCHDMHGGDPRGMIRPEMRGNLGCLQCHQDIGRDLRAHTHHEPTSSGSNCYACHMPPTTYGLVAVHPSHRITSPDPARAWRDDMPEACTLCHTDRTALWAAQETRRQYRHPAPVDPPSDPSFRIAESVRTLMGGDVVQRAVAASALTQDASYTTDATARLWAVPFLLLTMEDRYPAVRHFAHRGLASLFQRAEAVTPGAWQVSQLPAFDYLADAPARAAALERWWAWWRAADKSRIRHPGAAVPLDRDFMPVRAAVDGLRARQDQNAIAIGE